MPNDKTPSRGDPLNVPVVRDLVVASRMLVLAINGRQHDPGHIDDQSTQVWVDQVEKALDAIFRGSYPESVGPSRQREWEDPSLAGPVLTAKHPRRLLVDTQQRRVASEDGSPGEVVHVANDPAGAVL